MTNSPAPKDGEPPIVSVIIVNFNGAGVLTRCLQALARATEGCNYETIVVDNASTDGSAELLDASGDNVRVIRLSKNIGFGRANNVGARAARGRYYLLLNSDCFLQPGCVEALVARLDTDSRCAVVGPRLLNADGTLQRSCHNFPSPIVFFLEQSSLWKLLRPVHFIANRLSIAGSHAQSREVDWLAGACLLVRPGAFDEVGGFDARFFFYWEEADLCMRLRKHGWKVVFDPSGLAVHLGGGSTTNPFMLLNFFNSLYLFYASHYTTGQLLLVRAETRLMALYKAATSYLRGRLAAEGRENASAMQSVRAWLRVAGL